MRPTEVLMAEHRVIEQVLNCLEQMADVCEAGQPLDVASANQAIDFIRTFADRCHHAKEEDLLFPRMEQIGFSRARADGRDARRARAGPPSCAGGVGCDCPDSGWRAPATEAFVEHARAYVQLLRQHIYKEDHCLFPLADQAFSTVDQDELARSFSKVEHEDLGPDIHEKYLRVADQLADRFGVAKVLRPSDASHGGCSHHTAQAPL